MRKPRKTTRRDDPSPQPAATPRPQSDPARRPLPLVRVVVTIATGAALVVLTYYSNYTHREGPDSRHTPFGTLAGYSVVVMSVAGLCNGAILVGTWGFIRGAAARGLLLAAAGASTGAVAGECIGSLEWEGGDDAIARAAGAVGVGFINMMVWAVGGAVSGEPSRPRPRTVDGGEGGSRSGRPRPSLLQAIAGLVILTALAFAVARLDRAYVHACMTRLPPPRGGLVGWNETEDTRWIAAVIGIVVNHVSVLSTIVLGNWVARRISDRRASGLVPVAVVFLLLFALIGIFSSMSMLGASE